MRFDHIPISQYSLSISERRAEAMGYILPKYVPESKPRVRYQHGSGWWVTAAATWPLTWPVGMQTGIVVV